MKNKVKMQYETYCFLKDLIQKEQKELQEKYIDTLKMIGDNKEFRKAKDGTYNNFIKEYKKLCDMIEELHYAAFMSEGPNVSEQMKKFWGFNK